MVMTCAFTTSSITIYGRHGASLIKFPRARMRMFIVVFLRLADGPKPWTTEEQKVTDLACFLSSCMLCVEILF